MARTKKKAEPGFGDNSGELSDDDFDALRLYYERQISAAEAKVEVAKAALKVAQRAVNDNYALVKANLHYTRIDFEGHLKRKKAALEDPEAFALSLERLRRLDVSGGVPVGAQMELPLPSLGDTADDKARAFLLGARAYLDWKECVPPSEIDPILHQDWIAGFNDEMTKVAQKMGRAEAIIAEREGAANKARAAGTMQAEDTDPDQTDLEDEIDDVEAQARALKGAGWADGAPESPPMEEDNGGKTIRTPKVA